MTGVGAASLLVPSLTVQCDDPDRCSNRHSNTVMIVDCYSDPANVTSDAAAVTSDPATVTSYRTVMC